MNTTSKPKKILMWGSKSKARIIHEMIVEQNIGIVEFIFDADADCLNFSTKAVLINSIDKLLELTHDIKYFVVCIGGENGYARLKTSQYLCEIALKPLSLIHERAFIEPTSEVGVGCHVMPFVVVHKFSKIGEYTILNTNCTIDHECVIGRGVHVMGSAAVAGRVEVSDFASIGTNATILPDLKIGEGAVVGAGAVVTRNVDPYDVVAGVPAKKISERPRHVYDNIVERLLIRGGRS
ncbi:NeuD/PglB/VioB family sugar acetyltransferase [Bosea sp. PAMC 26642]|uniref:NeuD/PglB/VioB family sugar acetyltransferase n=1 Tax=Bosea sp. (strain PAMC 26642) TaxID=1792307 RepID=UPI000AAC2E01|nr:NeuD/PglB/VioB family sugar acetyltransferase [Bosea sp. PAMC 26642]